MQKEQSHSGVDILSLVPHKPAHSRGGIAMVVPLLERLPCAYCSGDELYLLAR
jgi:hypothetical protein